MPRSMHVVVHIPKSAGSALLDTFGKNFWMGGLMPVYPNYQDAPDLPQREYLRRFVHRGATPKTKCIFGHEVWHGIHEMLPATIFPDGVEPLYTTFLRHPVGRCISLYNFVKGKPDSMPNAMRDEIRDGNLTLEQWIAKDGRHAYERRNGQLRRLLMGQSPGPDLTLRQLDLTREHLEAGKEILRRFWFVGTTETFDDDAAYLYGKLGFWKFAASTQVNTTPRKEKTSDEAKAVVAEYNALDVALYQYARQLRDDYVASRGNEWNHYIEKSQRARALYDAVYVRGVRRLIRPDVKTDPKRGATQEVNA